MTQRQRETLRDKDRNWETRLRQEKMGRQDVRKKNGETDTW